MSWSNLAFSMLVCASLITISCGKQKDIDKTSERRGESFLNCYLVKIRESPDKSDQTIFQECLICYAKICNFPHLL